MSQFKPSSLTLLLIAHLQEVPPGEPLVQAFEPAPIHLHKIIHRPNNKGKCTNPIQFLLRRRIAHSGRRASEQCLEEIKDPIHGCIGLLSTSPNPEQNDTYPACRLTLYYCISGARCSFETRLIGEFVPLQSCAPGKGAPYAACRDGSHAAARCTVERAGCVPATSPVAASSPLTRVRGRWE